MDNIKRIKSACYSMNVSMAVVGNLPPLLFITFHNEYGISYSLLGLLVLINFSTQLMIDLIFTFYSHKFDIRKTVKTTPVLTVIGLLVFTAWPAVFPSSAYVGLVIGTIIFSSSAGLAEVLLNPVIAALPSDNTERDLSMLHSSYAWGAVGVVIIGSLFILGFGATMWKWLVVLMALIPLLSFFLYIGADLPEISTGGATSNIGEVFKNGQLWLCAVAIFLGGALECTMAQWCSGFAETALGVPKIFGDIFGVALFSVMLGTGRTLYTKHGKSIERVLLCGVIACFACYLVAALSSNAVIGLLACALTGLSASMLWPGSIITVSERIPTGGVIMYALMASGGDLGASVGPELVGVITDAVAGSVRMVAFAEKMGLTGEQLGMKCGLLIGALFALAAIPIYIKLFKTRSNKAS
jgi:fucose permease